ncbi:MAG: DMT family transporter [Pseudomonadota bacterium]
MDKAANPLETNKKPPHYLAIAIGSITLSALSYTILSIFVKLASQSVPTNFILFFRYGICLIVLLPFIAMQPQKVKTSLPWLHIIRGTVGVLSIGCFFFSLRYVPLAQAMLLSVTTPLFVPFVLKLTRNIPIIPKLYWGIVIGLIGVALVLHPGSGSFHFAMLVALSSAIFRAISSSFVRHISQKDQILTIMFYYFLIGTILSGASLFFNLHHFSHLPWFYLLLVGIFSVLYQFFLTFAYRMASIRLVSPFTYLGVVFSALADWLIWHKMLSAMAITGIVLVFIGALLTVYLGSKEIK